MDIQELTKKSTLPAYVELFVIDCSSIVGLETIYYLTPNANSDGTPITFGGDTYTPFPIQLTAYSQDSEGAPSRPTLTVSNINRMFGTMSFLFKDIIGAKVTYYRTFESYLGTLDKISASPLKFTISKKVVHNVNTLGFELRTPLDSDRGMLPKRQMLTVDFPGLGINKVF